MDKDKIKKELKKLLSDKKISSSLAILLILSFILIAINITMPRLTSGNAETKEDVKNNAKEVSYYEDEQKNELISILKKIDGVKEVDVMINFESGEVKVPAYDKTEQTTVTEETDGSGSKRVNNQVSDGSKVVMTTDGGTDEPFILQTYKPKVVGVVVVAEGAADSKIKHNIEVAVASLYNLEANKVNVYPMK